MKSELVSNSSLVPVSPRWERAAYFQNLAAGFERGKLYAQVMLGFELLGLKREFGVAKGNNQHDAKRISQNGTSSPADEFLLEVQTKIGVSRTLAYRYMHISATLSEKKLRQFEALAEVDWETTSVAQLPEAAQVALTDAVKKLTDGKTQQEFQLSLGLIQKTPPAPPTGGDNEWKSWVAKKHPELCPGGKAPKRAHVEKERPEVLAEFVQDTVPGMSPAERQHIETTAAKSVWKELFVRLEELHQKRTWEHLPRLTTEADELSRLTLVDLLRKMAAEIESEAA